MARGAIAYGLTVKPIILKQLLVDCDINQGTIGEVTGLARTTINIVVNRGYIPMEHPDFKSQVEMFISNNARARKWLTYHCLKVQNIWDPLGREMKRAHPVGTIARVVATRKGTAVLSGNPEHIHILREVEVITEDTKRHFRLFKNPFINDVQEEKDIYMSDEHHYIEAAMIDAAKHAGFLAVVGEVQSGKSIMRRKVVLTLQREGNVRVIFPQIVDKDRVTAASLCDAIIHDISSEKPRVKLEEKSRQVLRLLLARHKQGSRHVIIVEEAHDLGFKVLKLLKRFYEMEDGYTKLLGIILIGQPELKDKLDEGEHPDMREVIRRIQIAEIRGLNGNIKDYLALKFKRVGAKAEDIFTDEAIASLSGRLTNKDGRTGKTISHAYPGLVNNYAAKAMNLACQMGCEKVTEEVVMEI
ncbi:MAG: ExeA family protein [Syntrophorhabdaceae bacterium]|nr:ExeA family protein [Syntrophorhabdaceae bacterium]